MSLTALRPSLVRPSRPDDSGVEGRIKVMYLIPRLCEGGAERQLSLLARNLDRGRFCTCVGTLADGGELENELVDAGVPIISLVRRGRLDVRPILKLAKQLRRERVDVLHSFLFIDNLFGRLAGFLARTPVVIASARGIEYDVHGPRASADRVLQRFCDAVVANSRWMKGQLIRMGIVPKRIRVIHNGVETERFGTLPSREAARKALGLPLDARVIGTVGRLSPPKDHGTFLRMAKLVRQKRRDTHFLIVGDGELRTEIQAEIAGRGLQGCVHLCGRLSDVRPALAAMDIFALTSRTESLPNTVLEAMAAGLPVVATNAGGTNELVRHGETGILCPVGDAAALATAACRLLDDAGEAKRMGNAGRAVAASEFSSTAMLRSYEELYSILRERRYCASSL